MKTPLYSIRMHASEAGTHISGAEHLASAERLELLAASLLRRALAHPRGVADEIRITVEEVARQNILGGRLPDITTVQVADFHQGRRAALSRLIAAGVASTAAESAMQALIHGAAPGGAVMRGAMLIAAESGERFEPDPARGIRASRMDLTPAILAQLRQALKLRGLDNPHLCEALVLAGKVLLAPGIVAELCWSDDPGYTAGYVAAPASGYVRFPQLKPLGETRGGRAFFVREAGLNLAALIEFLETAPVLFDRLGTIHPDDQFLE